MKNKYVKDLETIHQEIKMSSFYKKYLKIINYLNEKNVDFKYAFFKKELIGQNNKSYIPLFTCYFPNTNFNNDNLFMVVIFEMKKNNLFEHEKISIEYFTNFNNLFFIIFFDINLKPTLYCKREEGNLNFLLRINEKHIEKF